MNQNTEEQETQMEASRLFSFLMKELQVKPEGGVNYSPLVLAYIGDAFYELAVRTKVLSRGNASVDSLNHRATNFSKAVTQGRIARLLMEGDLTEEEIRVLKRGRNAHPVSTSRRAAIAEYHMATGYEALIGWHFVNDRADRAMEIISLGFARLDEAEKAGKEQKVQQDPQK